jgi:predicted amidohydrolase
MNPISVCLIPLQIEVRNPSANLQHFRQRLEEASQHQLDMVCLPECAFTGYLYDEQDFEKFAEPIPGQTTGAISFLAQQYHCYICFGMLEKAPEGVYSSAVLIDTTGEIVAVQRKICEQPPFAKGTEVRKIDTEFGCFSILLCGDLFEDAIKAQLDKQLDALIVPLARSFDGQSPDVDRWLKEERQAYADEVSKIGATGLIVNLLESPSGPETSFGGAMIVSPHGKILAESPHGTDEALIYHLTFDHKTSNSCS